MSVLGLRGGSRSIGPLSQCRPQGLLLDAAADRTNARRSQIPLAKKHRRSVLSAMVIRLSALVCLSDFVLIAVKDLA